MEITGTITTMYNLQSGTSKAGNAWQKRDVIVEEAGGQYPNSIAVTAFGDRVEKLNTFKVGDLVTVKFDAKAKDYNGRAYNNINLYDISLAQAQQQQQNVAAAAQPTQAQPQPQLFAQMPAQPIQPAQPQFADDLPF